MFSTILFDAVKPFVNLGSRHSNVSSHKDSSTALTCLAQAHILEADHQLHRGRGRQQNMLNFPQQRPSDTHVWGISSTKLWASTSSLHIFKFQVGYRVKRSIRHKSHRELFQFYQMAGNSMLVNSYFAKSSLVLQFSNAFLLSESTSFLFFLLLPFLPLFPLSLLFFSSPSLLLFSSLPLLIFPSLT